MDKRPLKSIAVLALIPALFAPCVALASDSTVVPVEVTFGQSEARSMLDMINTFRTGSDAWYWEEDNTTKKVLTGTLQPLTYDYELEAMAMQRAAELALSYSHTRPDGTRALLSYPSGCNAVGENFACACSCHEAFSAWREDDCSYSGQGHRRNMLFESFNAVGIGHAVCNGIHYWVQALANRPCVCSSATSAANDTRVVSITVSDSKITNFRSAASVDRIDLEAGDTISLPSVTASLTVTGGWAGDLRFDDILTKVSWSVEDDSVARLTSDGQVVGIAGGETALVATTHGDTLRVPITVTGAIPEDHPFFSGDTDHDGLVDSYDAALILEYDVHILGGDRLDLSIADVDHDGVVDSYDASLILQYDVGKIDISKL